MIQLTTEFFQFFCYHKRCNLGCIFRKRKNIKNSERIEHQPANIKKVFFSKTKLIDGRVYFKNKMFVPDVGQLKFRFIQKFHDDPIARHANKTKTYEILNPYYY